MRTRKENENRTTNIYNYRIIYIYNIEFKFIKKDVKNYMFGKEKTACFSGKHSDSMYETLQLTNTWTQWAEVKHGTLLAINIAVLVGWFAIISGNMNGDISNSLQALALLHENQVSNDIENSLNRIEMLLKQQISYQNSTVLTVFVLLSVCLLVIGIIISALSFWPDTGKASQEESSVDTNLLFFGDAADLSYTEYKSKFTGTRSFEDMISAEIVYNSRIAKRKYDEFKYSLCISLLAYVVTGLTIYIFKLV